MKKNFLFTSYATRKQSLEVASVEKGESSGSNVAQARAHCDVTHVSLDIQPVIVISSV